ncbi:MAG: PQQ-like beta-propeller repeat protein [Planctomycetia bacterium]|nr:PQQ-like beta-propeller repeat protein [Planctomycetia bacterium]
MVCLTFLLGSVAHAENWPEFRGPTGQGLAPGALPTEWSETKNVVWKQELPGTGWSSPIIWEGRIYLTASVPVPDSANDDQALSALCLDARTGKRLWEKEVFRQEGKKAPRIHEKNSHASPTPLTDGQRLYVHFGHQGSAALDLDGKLLWRQTDLRYRPVHGNGGTLALVGELLIFSGDGADQQFVAALDRTTGKPVWKTARATDAFKKFSFCSPLAIRVQDKTQVVSPGAGMVGAYEPATGKELWRVNYGDGYSVVPRPVFGHGLVFLSTGYDTPEFLAIRVDGAGDVTKSHIAWSLKKGAPLTPSPLLVGDELYLVSDLGIASCLDARTGKLHWQQRLGGAHSASPMHADGKIYFLSEEGVGTVVKAGTTFESLARNPLKERTLASYAAADGALFIRTEKHLYRIQTK